ncbi:MAG TPA: hypothetical protein EYN96_01470 [Candidatus Hydrogenedentes bacterium]|nr:hypothetical protein [Candidatus Hydrogenedentota bacterium]
MPEDSIMLKEVLMWVLALGMIGVGLVVCTVLIERLVHQRKQVKYDELHKRMGLGSGDDDSPF